MTAATYKKTALKVLVLWNLPALFLLADAFHVGSSVIVQLQDKTMDMNPFKPLIQHLDAFGVKILSDVKANVDFETFWRRQQVFGGRR